MREGLKQNQNHYWFSRLALPLVFMKSFDVPVVYRSPLISAVKKKRKEADKLKKDFSPTLLDFGSLKVYLARHFGFCYGVENAIDIAFKTIEENPGKRIFLLSEMIHNPTVNADLSAAGVKFLQDNSGKQLIPFEELTSGDCVLIPAFGTTLPIEEKLRNAGIAIENYNTTCPFVEKVWNRSEAIAKNNYTIVIHGKPSHEETRATFSHAGASAPTVVVRDMAEAVELSRYILGTKNADGFHEEFKGQHTPGFNPTEDLNRIGVVNQTTMLASETQGISDFLKTILIEKYQLTSDNLKEHFADTRDTLCYATNDNQSAVMGMLGQKADFAIVVGGYNSSNTSHLVELCEAILPTFYIDGVQKILSGKEIMHYNFQEHRQELMRDFLPGSEPVTVLITSGASCPDAVVEDVLRRLTEIVKGSLSIEEMVSLQSGN